MKDVLNTFKAKIASNPYIVTFMMYGVNAPTQLIPLEKFRELLEFLGDREADEMDEFQSMDMYELANNTKKHLKSRTATKLETSSAI